LRIRQRGIGGNKRLRHHEKGKATMTSEKDPSKARGEGARVKRDRRNELKSS